MTGTRGLLLKGVAWIGAANVIVNMFGIVSTVILARLLAPEDFGLVAIAFALLAIIAIISEFSFAKALVQHDDPQEAHYRTAWTMNVLRGFLVGAIIAAIAVPAAGLYGDERLTDIFLVLALTTIVGSLLNPKLAVFERRLQFNQTFILKLTGKIIGFAITIGIAFAYRSYWALVLGPLAAESAIVIVSYILYPFLPKPTFGEYRDLLSYSIWLTLGRWVQALNWRSDPLVLGYFFSPELLGMYAMGNRITSKTISEVTSPIENILFPAFAKLKGDAERLRSGYLRSQGVLCLLCFPVGAGFAVLAPEIVFAALGEKWALAIPVVQVLALVRMLQITENLNAVAMATGQIGRAHV